MPVSVEAVGTTPQGIIVSVARTTSKTATDGRQR